MFKILSKNEDFVAVSSSWIILISCHFSLFNLNVIEVATFGFNSDPEALSWVLSPDAIIFQRSINNLEAGWLIVGFRLDPGQLSAFVIRCCSSKTTNILRLLEQTPDHQLIVVQYVYIRISDSLTYFLLGSQNTITSLAVISSEVMLF